jgi:uncharacterized MAPEG superfamily protein
MSLELTYLTWSVVIVLGYLVVQVLEQIARNGLVVALTYQTDKEKPIGVLMQRFNASFSNFLVSYPAFISLVVIIALTNSSSDLTTLGAAIWFWARIAHIPAHVSGLPVIRTLVWAISIAGLVMMLYSLLS